MRGGTSDEEQPDQTKEARVTQGEEADELPRNARDDVREDHAEVVALALAPPRTVVQVPLVPEVQVRLYDVEDTQNACFVLHNKERNRRSEWLVVIRWHNSNAHEIAYRAQ
jgi:nitrate reductase cytochrome c-type subunit